ncbi:MAG: TrkH family potassium uptake protein [Erysipelotrichaceae bacterium]|nr:TrkH family potassium uptake protein [Erysipelotrichaceae bacterium]
MKLRKAMRKVKPVQLIASGFALTILIGTILLSLPISNVREPLNILDNLFMSTTSVCVTGLAVTTVVEQYSIFGQLVILLLIQIGGLGFMSILAFGLLIMKRRLSLHEKYIVQESVGQTTLHGMGGYLKRVFKYTFVMELIGAILLAIRFLPKFGPIGIFYAIFHSVSAFCNAGLDLLGSTSLMQFVNDPLVNITIILLIVSGGLGFAVWFDLKDSSKKAKSLSQLYRKLSLHTKWVIKLTVGFILAGAILFYLTEHNNPATLAGKGFFEQLMICLFQSVTLRTAGFSTIDCGSVNEATKFFMLFFMLTGGSTGGTAGGIKITTFLILVVSAMQSHFAENGLVLSHRSIPRNIVNKAYLLLVMYISCLVFALFFMLMIEPFSFMDLLFEAVSAIATVGLSTGITANVSVVSKILIILLMYIGRTGPMSVFLSLFNTKQKNQIQYPKAEILIG